jgi:methyltransferase of ATP-grasp peptide maturase system
VTDETPPAVADLERRLSRSLVDGLSAREVLRSERWKRAFQKVSRQLFVPRIFVDRQRAGRYELLDGGDPGSRREWLEHVYEDEPLVTELDGDTWLSSSTQPSLMAMMLEALAVTGTERVLEIGTGTGYNAALLCEGLGSEQVTSIDIDGGLVNAARVRLHRMGYRPDLATADGATGYPGAAPYDRIMATCSMPRIPAEWIAQAAPRGRIMVNLYRELGGGALALLTVADDAASGYFLPFAGGFMPTRTFGRSSAIDLLDAHLDEDGERTRTTVRAAMLDDDAFGMFASLRLPLVQRLGLISGEGPEQTWLLGEDGSWAYQASTKEESAVQGGPVRLWTLLEEVHRDWAALDRPARHRFGLTVTSAGVHLLWHASPGGTSWIL